jgi:hypothetical protein
MRKVIFNKWFLLAALLTISLSAFSFVAYKKTEAVCAVAPDCCRRSMENNTKNELLWDIISRQFTSFISIQ